MRRVFSNHQGGQAIIEYSLILVLVVIVVIALLSTVGSSLSNRFKSIITALQRGSTLQIISDMNARMLAFYNAHGSWPRTWSPYNFTDIGLDPNDYSQPINGLHISPHGSEVAIGYGAGSTAQIYAKDLNGNTVHLNSGWAIWCPVNNAYCYVHTVAPGNEVDPASIYATGY